jgi:hypothetical protein
MDAKAEKIALFRYGLIAPLVLESLARGELARRAEEIASRQYDIPGSTRTSISVDILPIPASSSSPRSYGANYAFPRRVAAAGAGELVIPGATIIFRGPPFAFDPTALFQAAERGSVVYTTMAPRVTCLIRAAMPTPCIGASSSARKMSRSRVPCRMSIANFENNSMFS